MQKSGTDKKFLMDTPKTANSKEYMAKTWEMMPDFVKKLYYDKLNPSMEYMVNMIQAANPPEVVAKAILRALKARKMRIRYVGGKDVQMMPFLIIESLKQTARDHSRAV